MFKRIMAIIMVIVLFVTGNDMTAYATGSNSSVQEGTTVKSNIGTPEIRGNNSLGAILSDTLAEEQSESVEYNGNYIGSVEISGTIAKVSYVAMCPATLVVGIYDNKGRKLLATGTAEVTPDSREVSIDIPLDTMPKYFYIKSFLIETDSLNPLCAIYENPNYTREMQDFFAKTTDDFEQDRVHNLDESKTNNFVVYNEDINIIEKQDEINKLVSGDEESMEYVFENIDSNISTLKAGDLFVYNLDNPLVVKVENIDINGNTAFIDGASAEMEEVFEYVKIDTSCEIDVPQNISSQNTIQNNYGIKGKVDGWIDGEDGFRLEGEGISKEIKEELPGGFELEGKVGLTPGAKCKIYYTGLFDYKYAELAVTFEFEASFTTTKGWDKEIKLGEIPLAALSAAVTVSVPVYFLIEVEGSVSFGFTMKSELGFAYDSDLGMRFINPLPEIKVECKTEASIFVGIRSSVKLTAIGVVSGEVYMDIGPLFQAANAKELTIYSPEEELKKHVCRRCLDGDISVTLRTGVILRFCGVKVEEEEMPSLTRKIGDFYYSFDNKDFGFGECPNIAYKQEFQIVENFKDPLEGVKLTGKNTGEVLVSDEDGKAQVFLNSGIEIFTLEKDGYESRNYTIDVMDSSKRIVNMYQDSFWDNDSSEDAEIIIDKEKPEEDDSETGDDSGNGSDDENDNDNESGNEDDDNDDENNSGTGDGNDVLNPNAVKQFIVDEGSTAILTEGGNLYTCGLNSDYCLTGCGNTIAYAPLTKILTNIESVNLDPMSGGGAITKDDSLYMWGRNDYGQVGNGGSLSCPIPTKVLDNVRTTYYIWDFSSLAITKDGKLYTWGFNAGSRSPEEILDNISSDFEPDNYGNAVTKDGSLYMWNISAENNGTGEYWYSPVKVLDNVEKVNTKIPLGYSAITEDGSLYMWGRNEYGEVGIGTVGRCYTPTKILDNVVEVKEHMNVDTLSGTINYNPVVGALTQDGSLYMWGRNLYGVLGDGTTTNSLSPKKILDNVKKFNMNNYYCMAITEDDSLYMWGNNNGGQIGNGTKENCLSPVKVLDDVVEIKAYNTCVGAITKDNSLYMWGGNYYGQIGDGNSGSGSSCVNPTKILDNVASFCFGETMTAAVTKNGELYTWGWGEKGQLGTGDTENCTTPVKVLDGVSEFNVMSKTCGAIMKDGSFYMWGNNNFGQLGDGLTTNWLTPTKMELEEMAIDNTMNVVTNTIGKNVSTMINEKQFNSTILSYTNDGSDSTHDGNDDINTVNVYTAIFRNKEPGETYNFYVMKERTGEGDATPSNILYIDQAVADLDGKVTVSYIPSEEYEGAQVFLSGRLGKYDFTKANITANDQLYTGEELYADVIVTYEGKELTEGIDYELSGSYCAIEPGKYTLTVTGMGEYHGSQTLTYHIRKFSLDVFGVIFDSNGGTAVETQEVEGGQPAAEPETPIRENHHFKGWYLNGELYDFSTPVTSTLELVAQWEEFKKLAAPTASVPTGSRVNKGTKVVFATENADAEIFYTTDGSVPTVASTLYDRPITLDTDVTIKVVAVLDGFYNSDTATFDYTVVKNGDAFDTVAPEDVPAEGIPEGIWIGKIADQTYTGKAIKPEVRVYDGTRRLVVGRDYTVSYKNNVKAQTDLNGKKVPAVVIKGKGNYRKTLTVPFVIQPLDLDNETITVDDVTVACNGKVQKKNPTIYYGTKKLSGKDVEVFFVDTSEGAYKELGTYPVKLSGKGNFSGERMVNLTITDKTLMSSVKVAKVAAQSYQNGDAIEPALAVMHRNKELDKGKDYEVTFNNNKEIGTATAILTGKGDYAGIKRVNFKITGTPMKQVKIEGITNKTYTGDAIFHKLTLTHNGTELPENAYTVKYTNNTDAGTATITITGKGAFTGTVKKKFRIIPYDLKADTEHVVDDIAQNLEVVYEKGGSQPDVDVIYKGQKLVAGKDYTIRYQKNNGVTDATFIIKGKGNFKGTLTGTFKIKKKAFDDMPAPVTIAADDISYTGKAGGYVSKPVLTDSNGKKLKAGVDYEKDVKYTLKDGTPLDKTSTVGIEEEVSVTVTGKGNYTGRLSTTYKVTELDFKKVKIKVAPQTYNGEAILLTKEDVEVTLAGLPLTFGEDYEIVEGSYKNNIRKGTASVTVKGKGSYGGSKTVKFKVLAKELKK